MSIPLIAFSVGLALIVISIIGGGLEVKEIKIPNLGLMPRVLSFLMGSVLIAVCLAHPGLLSGDAFSANNKNDLTARIGLPVSSPRDASSELSYKVYHSEELGAIFSFPIKMLSLDTTQRKERRLTLVDGDGRVRVKLTRTSFPDDLRDVRLGRQREKEQLEKLGYTVTYVAPEKERAWKDWYVLSGVANNMVFYYRRWYVKDSVGSIEFVFPKELSPLYDKLIPVMTQELAFTETTRKVDP
jgi:hypothetical protein